MLLYLAATMFVFTAWGAYLRWHSARSRARQEPVQLAARKRARARRNRGAAGNGPNEVGKEARGPDDDAQ